MAGEKREEPKKPVSNSVVTETVYKLAGFPVEEVTDRSPQTTRIVSMRKALIREMTGQQTSGPEAEARYARFAEEILKEEGFDPTMRALIVARQTPRKIGLLVAHIGDIQEKDRSAGRKSDGPDCFNRATMALDEDIRAIEAGMGKLGLSPPGAVPTTSGAGRAVLRRACS